MSIHIIIVFLDCYKVILNFNFFKFIKLVKKKINFHCSCTYSSFRIKPFKACIDFSLFKFLFSLRLFLLFPSLIPFP